MNPSPWDYQIGGSLPETAPTYIIRQADQALYRSLLAGEFCSVLNARQMGKSSLVVQTIKRLRGDGITCITLDLSDLGSQQISLEQWYGGVAFKILSGLQLFNIQDFVAWWQTHQTLSPVQRLGELWNQVIFPQVGGKIVVFVDEIDSVLSFQEPLDDFFSWIRSCYNQRALNPNYRRLSFTLLGVATPADLIQDPQRTPFNIGTAIDLQPFTKEEIAPLSQGFQLRDPKLCQALLGEILDWTGGQPFLTQKLCAIVSGALQRNQGENLEIEQVKPWVKTIVEHEILTAWETQDEPIHLRTIRNRLLRSATQGTQLLDLYDRVLSQGTLPLENSPEQSQLRLSGIVRCFNGHLQVYNPIYAHIFSRDWLSTVIQNLRPYGENLQAWLDSDQTDDSRLLRGQALVNALAWAVNKQLSSTDYEFLAASRDLALQAAQEREVAGQQEIERLHREKELLEQLAQAQEQRRLAELELRRQQWQRRVSITGSIASMLAFLCGVIWMQINTQRLTLRLNRQVQLGEAMLTAGKPDIALFYGLEAARLNRGAVGIEPKVQLRLWLLLERSQQQLMDSSTLPFTATNPISAPSNLPPDLPPNTQIRITPQGAVEQWVGDKRQRSIVVSYPLFDQDLTNFTDVTSWTIVPSPTGKQFALQSPENPTMVEIWHFQEGLQGYLTHLQSVRALAWSEDGKLVATLSGSSSGSDTGSVAGSATGSPTTAPLQLTLWYQDFSPVAQLPVPRAVSVPTNSETEQGQLVFTPQPLDHNQILNTSIFNFQLEYRTPETTTPLLSINPATILKNSCIAFKQIPPTAAHFPGATPPDLKPPIPQQVQHLQRFCNQLNKTYFPNRLKRLKRSKSH